MMISILLILAFGLFAGWLIWGKSTPFKTDKPVSKSWYWVSPAVGFLIGLSLALATISSRDGWDEFYIIFVLYFGFWIPGLLIIPFIGNQVNPSPAWGWIGSVIGFPAAFVAATALGVALSFVFGNGF